jgi:hypothetical protein
MAAVFRDLSFGSRVRASGVGFGVSGSGILVSSFGRRAWGFGFRASVIGCRIRGVSFKVQETPAPQCEIILA